MEPRLATQSWGGARVVEWWRWDRREAIRPPAAASAERSGAGSFAFAALLGFTFVLVLAPQSYLPLLAHLRIAMLLAGAALGAHALDCLIRRRGLVRPSREIWTAAVLALWAAATAPLSYWPGGTASLLLDLYFKAFVVFLLLAGLVDSTDRLRRLSEALVLMAVPLALTAVSHYGSGLTTGTVDTRIAGYRAPLTQNPNDLALMMNLLLPLCVAFVVLSPPGWRRAGWIVAAGLIGGAVIVTFSRAGFLALATTAAFYSYRSVRRGRAGWVAAGLIVVLALAPVLPQGYLGRLGTILDTDSDPTGSAQARWSDTLWSLRFVLDHPLLGAGAGMNVLALNELRGPAWKAVHNVYLEYAVDLGLPGLGLFLLLLSQCLRSTIVVQKRTAGREERGLAVFAEALQASLLAFSVSALFHPVAYQFYFFYFGGLAVAARGVLAAEERAEVRA